MAEPFAIAVLDRSTAPGIQGWVFSSVEVEARQRWLNRPSKQPRELDDGDNTDVDDSAINTNPVVGEETEQAKQTSLLAAEQLLALYTKFASISPPQPFSLDEDHSRREAARQAASALLGHPPPPPMDTIMIGSMHETTRRLLMDYGARVLRNDVFGVGGPFVKFLVPLHQVHEEGSKHGRDDGRRQGRELPPGMRFDEVREGDYEEVMGRNQYIRHPKNLDGMGGLSVRYRGGVGSDAAEDKVEDDAQDTAEEKIVAFAFIGHDGCLRTLWVDETVRGLGIAGTLARELLKRSYDVFFTAESHPLRNGEAGSDTDPPSIQKVNGSLRQSASSSKPHPANPDQSDPHPTITPQLADWMTTNTEMAHTDITPSNRASARVFQKLGAVPAWEAFWVRVDLGRCGRWVRDGVVDEL